MQNEGNATSKSMRGPFESKKLSVTKINLPSTAIPANNKQKIYKMKTSIEVKSKESEDFKSNYDRSSFGVTAAGNPLHELLKSNPFERTSTPKGILKQGETPKASFSINSQNTKNVRIIHAAGTTAK